MDPRDTPSEQELRSEEERVVIGDPLMGAHLVREAMGGTLALEDYEEGFAVALTHLGAFSRRYLVGSDDAHATNLDTDA